MKMDFNEIYKRYWDKVYRLCMGYFNRPALAQDLTQDTFVQVWKHLSSFRQQAEVGTWIFRIATNICLRQSQLQQRMPLRKKKRWKPTTVSTCCINPSPNCQK